MQTKLLDSIIVKPVGPRCNLNCEYCFYIDKCAKYPQASVMTDETLDILIKQMMEQSGNNFGITWQGGEPTLAGLDFYKKVVDKMMAYGGKLRKSVTNSLQTNGYNLNDEFVKFLHDYNFLVGLSLDGPKEIHNKYRKTSTNKETFDKVEANGKKLQKAGVATNILCCITNESWKQAELIYKYFKTNNWQWLQFIPIHEKDEHGYSKLFSVGAEEWGKFMCSIFDLWYDDFNHSRPAPIIRFIENAFHSHLGFDSPECTMMESCGVYVIVEHNGDVYTCDFFVNDSNYLGNLHKTGLFSMLNSPAQNEFGNKKRILPHQCHNCNWKKFCNGGCPKYRNTENLNYFCPSYKLFFNHTNERFQSLVKWCKENNKTAFSSQFKRIS